MWGESVTLDTEMTGGGPKCDILVHVWWLCHSSPMENTPHRGICKQVFSYGKLSLGVAVGKQRQKFDFAMCGCKLGYPVKIILLSVSLSAAISNNNTSPYSFTELLGFHIPYLSPSSSTYSARSFSACGRVSVQF